MQTRWIIFFMPFLLLSCDVTTLSDEEAGIISFTDIYPTTEEACRQSLVGSESRSWQIDQFTLSSILGFQQCRLDDSIILYADGKFAYDGGEILCGAEDNAQHKMGTWGIDHSTRQLIFQVDGSNSEKLYIEMLTNSEVVLSGSYFGLEVVGKFVLN